MSLINFMRVEGASVNCDLSASHQPIQCIEYFIVITRVKFKYLENIFTKLLNTLEY